MSSGFLTSEKRGKSNDFARLPIKWPNLLPSKMLSAVLLGLFMVNYQERLSQFSGITNALIPLAPKGNGQVILSDIVFLAVLIFVSLFLGSLLDKFVRKRGESLSGNLTYGIIIFVGVIFLSQAITVSKIFAQTIPQSKVVPPAIKKPDNSLLVS